MAAVEEPETYTGPVRMPPITTTQTHQTRASEWRTSGQARRGRHPHCHWHHGTAVTQVQGRSTTCTRHQTSQIVPQGLPGEATHRWVFYVRSPLGHDLSVLISKVTVILHSSFANPKREFAHPPYEVEEAGWGEFDIAIVVRSRGAPLVNVMRDHQPCCTS